MQDSILWMMRTKNDGFLQANCVRKSPVTTATDQSIFQNDQINEHIDILIQNPSFFDHFKRRSEND
jgi:hypothetical protein